MLFCISRLPTPDTSFPPRRRRVLAAPRRVCVAASLFRAIRRVTFHTSSLQATAKSPRRHSRHTTCAVINAQTPSLPTPTRSEGRFNAQRPTDRVGFEDSSGCNRFLGKGLSAQARASTYPNSAD